LVRDHEHRLARLAQDLRDLLVAGRDPDLRVDHEEDDVRLGHGLAGLICDRARDRARVGDVDAAGVDEQKALRAPLADELLPVARHPGRLVHDRGPRAREPVDEGRLADVREADDRDGADELRHAPMVADGDEQRCQAPPSRSLAPEDAASDQPAASETKARPAASNANPNGVPPADELDTPACARPSWSTVKVSIVDESFSVTAMAPPPGENATCAGFVPRRGCVEPSMAATRPTPSALKPVIDAEPAFNT